MTEASSVPVDPESAGNVESSGGHSPAAPVTREELEEVRKHLRVWHTEAEKVESRLRKHDAETRRSLTFSDTLIALGVASTAVLITTLVWMPPSVMTLYNRYPALVAVPGVAIGLAVATVTIRILAMVNSTPPTLLDVHHNASARVLLADAANNCESIATQHLARARFYLAGGVITAVAGVFVYFALISMTVPQRRGERELRMLQAATADLAVQLEVKRSALEESSGPVDTAEINELLLKAERLEATLRKATEADSGPPRPLPSEVLSMVRNALAFLFIEVMAGFLFTLAQRNDAQASHWRAHRQVYERLLAVGEMARELAGPDASASARESVIANLLSPVLPQVVASKKNANPAVDAISALSSLLERTKSAAEDAAKKPGKP